MLHLYFDIKDVFMFDTCMIFDTWILDGHLLDTPGGILKCMMYTRYKKLKA